MPELGKTPRDQLLAVFDVLNEWFSQPDFRGCMFIKASSEFQEAEHAIHAQCTEHKRLLFEHFRGLAEAAGVEDPASVARQILLLKEGAIVMAHLGEGDRAAVSAKTAAAALIDAATGVVPG